MTRPKVRQHRRAGAYTFTGKPDPARMAILVERVLRFADDRDQKAAAVRRARPRAQA